GFSDTSSGSTDMDAEIKFQLLESDSMLPAVVVFGGVSLPVGSNDLTSDRVDPNAGLAVWFDDVDEVWQFFGSARFTLLEDANEEEFIQSAVSVGSAQKWGSGATTFFEYFGFLNDNDVVEDAHFLQGGLIFEVAPNATIDARVGVGLSDDSADLFAGFGGSFSL
ncbi:MAG: transporter, partial [Planctomycetota bacterium]